MSGATAPVIGGQLRSAPRLAPIVVPVAIGGLLATLAATFTLVTTELDSALAIGALILLAAAVIAEACSREQRSR
jgi:ABC-type tungstate transport system substrate-binding protein